MPTAFSTGRGDGGGLECYLYVEKCQEGFWIWLMKRNTWAKQTAVVKARIFNMSLDADSYIGVHRGCGSACEINSLHTALCKVYMKALHPRLHGICNWLNACVHSMKYNVFWREKHSKQKNCPWMETFQEHLPGTVPGTCVVAVQRSGGQSHWTRMECSSLKVQTFSSLGSGRGRNTSHTIASWTQPGRWNRWKMWSKINSGARIPLLKHTHPEIHLLMEPW